MSTSREIIPAIMPDSYEDMKEKATRVKGLVSWAQIDVMDGLFVPSVSWPYRTDDFAPFHMMVEKGELLPYLDVVHYEIDLMTERPEDEIPKWYALGCRRFLVHFESIDDVDVLEHIILTYSKKGVSEVGIALGAETPVEAIEPIVHEIDCVQLMGIARIGYQGEPFDERVIDRVKHLRQIYKNGIISVDGGVSLETAPRLLHAGVDRLVSGSALFKSNDIGKTIEEFQRL